MKKKLIVPETNGKDSYSNCYPNRELNLAVNPLVAKEKWELSWIIKLQTINESLHDHL